MPVVDPENIRLTIAKQETAEQSVALLLRAMCTAIHDAVDKPDPEHLVQIASHIDDNPKAWIDAVFANTPMADKTRGIELPSLSTEVRDAFAEHGQRQPQPQQSNGGDTNQPLHAAQQQHKGGAEQGAQPRK